MSEPADHARQVDRALTATEALVAAVREGQWSEPSGCPGWSVHDLLDHLVGGNLTLAAVLVDEAAPDPAGDHLGDDPVGAYRASGDRLRAAFGRPDALTRMVTVPAGTIPGEVALHLRLTELLVHGWDLARATGQSVAGLPADLAEQELVFSRRQLGQIPPERRPFAESQPVADDAPAVDRLAALLGRAVPGG